MGFYYTPAEDRARQDELVRNRAEARKKKEDDEANWRKRREDEDTRKRLLAVRGRKRGGRPGGARRVFKEGITVAAKIEFLITDEERARANRIIGKTEAELDLEAALPADESGKSDLPAKLRSMHREHAATRPPRGVAGHRYPPKLGVFRPDHVHDGSKDSEAGADRDDPDGFRQFRADKWQQLQHNALILQLKRAAQTHRDLNPRGVPRRQSLMYSVLLSAPTFWAKLWRKQRSSDANQPRAQETIAAMPKRRTAEVDIGMGHTTKKAAEEDGKRGLSGDLSVEHASFSRALKKDARKEKREYWAACKTRWEDVSKRGHIEKNVAEIEAQLAQIAKLEDQLALQKSQSYELQDPAAVATSRALRDLTAEQPPARSRGKPLRPKSHPLRPPPAVGSRHGIQDSRGSTRQAAVELKDLRADIDHPLELQQARSLGDLSFHNADDWTMPSYLRSSTLPPYAYEDFLDHRWLDRRQKELGHQLHVEDELAHQTLRHTDSQQVQTMLVNLAASDALENKLSLARQRRDSLWERMGQHSESVETKPLEPVLDPDKQTKRRMLRRAQVAEMTAQSRRDTRIREVRSLAYKDLDICSIPLSTQKPIEYCASRGPVCQNCGEPSFLAEVCSKLPYQLQSQGSTPACTTCSRRYWQHDQPRQYAPLLAQVQSEFFTDARTRV